MAQKVRVAIAGLGGRGRMTYAASLKDFGDICELVAIAEPIDEVRDLIRDDFGIDASMCFKTCEEMLKQPKLADVLFICTQDSQHAAQAVEALKKGYHLLLEKPIAPNENECRKIQQAAHKYGRFVVVCHVLRYTVFYQTIKQVIDSGVLGEIMTVDANENVCYWHQAHSFVRGNWRREDESSPMILAKSCHDMDVLRWLIGKKCKSVSSFGSLSHFKSENAPEGAALRCKDCPEEVRKNCKFDAYNFYKSCFVDPDSGEKLELARWPAERLANVATWENCKAALDNGPYGRCVYHCDNDVVDHQTVNLQFARGVTATFTMSAFTHTNSRGIVIMGTRGELVADNSHDDNKIHVYEFGKDEVVYDINKLAADLSGHGGGDKRMLYDYISALYKGEKPTFDIDVSMESHYMAFAAEKSRTHGGKTIKLK